MDSSLKIAVYGLWHLGCVTAASLASEGFDVWGIDPDPKVIEDLQSDKPPLFEPGLQDLIEQGHAQNKLHFTLDYKEALQNARLLWVTFDTPVDEEDRADVAYVEQQLDAVPPFIESGTLVLISSQVPAGFTDSLCQHWADLDPAKQLTYAYSPENLRLGKALKSFRAEDRIVIGLDSQDPAARQLLEKVLSPFSAHLEWMSVRSAEMVKHALNSFLAVSVALINEIARICEQTGADAKEVERGLKSEMRVGPNSYLGPGGPFGGGTLARDLRFLVKLGAEHQVQTPLFEGALTSNEIHKEWVQNAAARVLQTSDRPAKVTILGLSYKPGTDTLRRSEAVNLGLWLLKNQNVQVTFHDPVTLVLPPELADQFELTNDLKTALEGADLVVVATGWPQYREEITPDLLRQRMRKLVVIDQNRFLVNNLGTMPDLTYLAVGKPDDIAVSVKKDKLIYEINRPSRHYNRG